MILNFGEIYSWSLIVYEKITTVQRDKIKCYFISVALLENTKFGAAVCVHRL